MVERRSLKVVLPPTIYQNVTGTFHMFLIALTKDLIMPLAAAASSDKTRLREYTN